MARFEVPDGWTVQAFQFALDCTPEQEACLRRQFGGRRYARNWAVRTLKEDLTRYRETGEETDAPSLAGLRKRWNQAKDTECADAGTGQVWWPQISKEAFADGIKAAVDAYWNWQTSRAGNTPGQPGRVPEVREEGPRPGPGHLHHRRDPGRTRPQARHPPQDRDRPGAREHPAAAAADRQRQSPRSSPPPSPGWDPAGRRLPGPHPAAHPAPRAVPGSRVGVDVGVRVLATVANQHGEVIERVPNPRPLETALRQLRHLCRERSRRTRGSRRYPQTQRKITRLQRRVADIRAHHVHVLTTRLAKTHGEIVAEGLDAAGMLRQKGLSGARARRRGLSDSALGETRRQLAYKTGWYGSRLVIADRWYPSSRTCHACGHVQDIGWKEHWTCAGCGTSHQRDDNAAINLARYEPPTRVIAPLAQSGPRSSAEPTVRPGPAGQVAMKRGRDPANRLGNNPETGCQRVTHYDSLTGNGEIDDPL